MNICRQCFREKASDIGFYKVGFHLHLHTLLYHTTCARDWRIHIIACDRGNGLDILNTGGKGNQNNITRRQVRKGDGTHGYPAHHTTCTHQPTRTTLANASPPSVPLNSFLLPNSIFLCSRRISFTCSGARYQNEVMKWRGGILPFLVLFLSNNSRESPRILELLYNPPIRSDNGLGFALENKANSGLGTHLVLGEDFEFFRERRNERKTRNEILKIEGCFICFSFLAVFPNNAFGQLDRSSGLVFCDASESPHGVWLAYLSVGSVPLGLLRAGLIPIVCIMGPFSICPVVFAVPPMS